MPQLSRPRCQMIEGVYSLKVPLPSPINLAALFAPLSLDHSQRSTSVTREKVFPASVSYITGPIAIPIRCSTPHPKPRRMSCRLPLARIRRRMSVDAFERISLSHFVCGAGNRQTIKRKSHGTRSLGRSYVINGALPVRGRQQCGEIRDDGR